MNEFDSLLQVFKEIDNNLKNPMIENHIKSFNKDFDYNKLVKTIKEYINNFNTLIETDNDELLQEIQQRANNILSSTKEEYFNVHSFTNDAIYLIDKVPSQKNKSINNSNKEWDKFTRGVDFEKLKNIKKNKKDINYEEGEKVRVFLKKFAIYLQEKIPELKPYKWKLNQASTQLKWTEDNGFRLSFYKGDSLPKSTQINITFWSSWHGGIFIKDNENIVFSRDDVVKNLQEKYPNIEFVKDKQHIMAIHFENDMPTENEVIDAIKKLLDILESIQSEEKESVEDVVDTDKKKKPVIPKEVAIKKKSEIQSVLGVESLADTLASVIIKDFDEAGMMVGIFGKWGRGKTHFSEKLWDSIREKKIKYNRVIFSAWKYQDTKASWAYLYENIFSAYLDDNTREKTFISKLRFGKNQNWNKLVDNVENFYIEKKRIFKINLKKHTWFPIVSFALFFMIAFVWSFFIEKSAIANYLIGTFGVLVVIKFIFFYFQQKPSAVNLYRKYFFKKSFGDYLGLQAEIENELTILLKTWIPNSYEDKKIVLFVDDIDRCNIEQVIDIVDGLRVILDNPEIHSRLILVTAIDETILRQALKHKYEGFKDNNINSMYKEYLEKIFIIGLKLNTLNEHETEEVLRTILPNIDEVIEHNSESCDDKNIIEVDNQVSNNVVQVSERPEEVAINESVSTIIESQDNNEISEINIHEKAYLLEAIKNLDNVTPRKIRIFYYKYLMMKILFNIRIKEKGLISDWTNEGNEKIIIDLLISLANDNESDVFDFSVSDEILKDLTYVAKMVSVL